MRRGRRGNLSRPVLTCDLESLLCAGGEGGKTRRRRVTVASLHFWPEKNEGERKNLERNQTHAGKDMRYVES